MSTDSLVTPIGLQQMASSSGMAEAQLVKIMRLFMSDARIKQEIADARANRQPLHKKWKIQ